MKSIKFLPNKKIKLNGIVYKPYLVGELPNSFGIMHIDTGEEIKPGISEWFNFKGFTYVAV